MIFFLTEFNWDKLILSQPMVHRVTAYLSPKGSHLQVPWNKRGINRACQIIHEHENECRRKFQGYWWDFISSPWRKFRVTIQKNVKVLFVFLTLWSNHGPIESSHLQQTFVRSIYYTDELDFFANWQNVVKPYKRQLALNI